MALDLKAKIAAKVQAPAAAQGNGYTIGSLVQSLALDLIVTDGGTQARGQIDPATVAAYAEAMQDGARFPAVTVYYDGSSYWLADGFHRVAATRQQQRTEIQAEIRAGTKRDAVLYAVGANDTHGLRRSRTDMQRAIEILLRDDEWQQWNNSEIARRVGCSDKTVAAARERLSSEFPMIGEGPRLVERGGVTYEQARQPTIIGAVPRNYGGPGQSAPTHNPSRSDFDWSALPAPTEQSVTQEFLFKALADSMSADRIAANMPIRQPMEYDGALWIAVVRSTHQVEAVHVVPIESWHHWRGSLAESVDERRRTGMQASIYTGVIVSWRDRVYVLTHERLHVEMPKAPSAAADLPTPEGWQWKVDSAHLPKPEGWQWGISGSGYYLISDDGWITNKHATRLAAIEEAAAISAEPQRTPVATVLTPARLNEQATYQANIDRLLNEAATWQPGVAEHRRLLADAEALAAQIADADERRGVLAQIADERSAIGAYQDEAAIDDGEAPVERCLQGIEHALSDGETLRAQAFTFELVAIMFAVENPDELHRELKALPNTPSGATFPQLRALAQALPAVRIDIDGDDD